ncbi:MAG: Mrp/NBP35 family ATP-binding protein [Armatimonadetes bacterium]|nr:Mrp/NBP35 family ATP-binding protein [Armatimonadota bacterium]
MVFKRSPAITREQVLEALKDVQDPELHRSIVELDMVRDIAIAGGHVGVHAVLTISGCPLKDTIVDSIKSRVASLPGVDRVEVHLGVMNPEERQALIQKLRGGQGPTRPSPFLSGESPTNVIAVASGKGGVGKSTVTVNVAVALSRLGYRVGVIDADVYGFSIPRMLGVSGRPTIIDQMIIPLERDGIRVISIGFMLPGEDEAVVWRGPMLHKALTTFISEVHWGELDYLLMDLPPGTGDVSLSIAQTLPKASMLIVTTPQAAAAKVAQRSAKMAEKVNMAVVGVVENMSYFQPSADGDRIYLFGQGGGRLLAEALGVPLLGEIPIDLALREGGDNGQPLVMARPDSPVAQALVEVARKLAALVPTPAAVSGAR